MGAESGEINREQVGKLENPAWRDIGFGVRILSQCILY